MPRTIPNQSLPMVTDPAVGYVTDTMPCLAADYRISFPTRAWAFDPWTSVARAPLDIINDILGEYIIPTPVDSGP